MTDTFEGAIYADVHGALPTDSHRAGWTGTVTSPDMFSSTRDDGRPRNLRGHRRSRTGTPTWLPKWWTTSGLTGLLP